MFLCSSVSLLFSSKQAISSYFLIFWVTLHWRWACADKSKALSLWRSQTKCFHQEPASITFHYCPARKRQSLSSVYFCLHFTAQETYCAAEQELKAPRCAVFTAYYKCSEDYRLIYLIWRWTSSGSFTRMDSESLLDLNVNPQPQVIECFWIYLGFFKWLTIVG